MDHHPNKGKLVAQRLRWVPGGIHCNMPKLRHYDTAGTARFVTFNCYRNLLSLMPDRAKKILINNIELTREKHGFSLLGYVIMPDHVHLVVHPPEGLELGRVIGEIKSRSARAWFGSADIDSGVKRVFWEKRCYDHNCRSNDSVVEKIEYCHNNPVRAGLVREPGEWEWSSYRWYTGCRDVLLRMDRLEL